MSEYIEIEGVPFLLLTKTRKKTPDRSVKRRDGAIKEVYDILKTYKKEPWVTSQTGKSLVVILRRGKKKEALVYDCIIRRSGFIGKGL